MNLIYIFFLTIQNLYACVGCSDLSGTTGGISLVYLLMIFIGIIYLPMFLIFKMIYKFKDINENNKK